MEGYSAEVTCAEATAVMSNGKLDLGYSGYAALGNIVGMKIPRIRQGVNSVELLALKRRHRRILHEHLVAIVLYYSLTVYGIGIFILYGKCSRISALVGLKLIKVSNLKALKVDGIPLLCKVHRASHVAYLLHGYPFVKELCESY